MAIPTSPHARYLASDLSGTHSDGDLVATWPDASGNGRDVTQATAADQPVFRSPATAPSGASSVDFLNTGARVMLSATLGSALSVSTWAGVILFPTILASNRVFFDGDTGRHAVFYDGSGQWTMFAGSVLTATETVSAVTAYKVVAVFNGASSALYIDNVEVVSGDVGAQALDRVVLGAEADGANDPDVEMVEVLLYDRALDATERADLDAYFDSTYFGGSTPPNEGSAALSLGLALDATGSRQSAGTAAFAIGLQLQTTGSRPSQGEAHFTIGLSLSATGASLETEPAPPAQTLAVPAEPRELTVAAEPRTVNIAREARRVDVHA